MLSARSSRERRGVVAAFAMAGLLLVHHAAAETRICLNMIMKNEKDILEKCLDLISPELSGWTLCDTGSTDGSQKLAKNYFKKRGIPGGVVSHKWKDFSANRNLCIEAGTKFSLAEAKRQGMPKGSHFCDYFWFLDVDQFMHLPPDGKPGGIKAMNLTKPVYHMVERGVGVVYTNVRLASTKHEWQWVGEVHEYVARVDGVHNDRNDVIEGYWLEHDASGGSDGKRFVRDEQILLKAVKERPQDPRSRFYLANTFRALNKQEEAIEQYIARINIGGWDEERYMAAFNIAELMKRQYDAGRLLSKQTKALLANWDAALFKTDAAVEEAEEAELAAAQQAAADAAAANATAAPGNNTAAAAATRTADQVAKIFERRRAREFNLLVAGYTAALQVLPYRPETWAKLARLYRLDKHDNERCYNYAAAGLAQGPAKKDALFLDNWSARYDLLDEACTCGYYVDRVFAQGQLACRQLEQRLVDDMEQEPENPVNVHLQGTLKRVRGNLGWYDKKAGCDAGSKQCAWKQQ